MCAKCARWLEGGSQVPQMYCRGWGLGNLTRKVVTFMLYFLEALAALFLSGSPTHASNFKAVVESDYPGPYRCCGQWMVAVAIFSTKRCPKNQLNLFA